MACGANPPAPKQPFKGKYVHISFDGFNPNIGRLRSPVPCLDSFFKEDLPSFYQYEGHTDEGYEYCSLIDADDLEPCFSMAAIPIITELVRGVGKETIWTIKSDFVLKNKTFVHQPDTLKLAELGLYYAFRIYNNKGSFPPTLTKPLKLSESQLAATLPYFLSFADTLEKINDISLAKEQGISPFNNMPDSLLLIFFGTPDTAYLNKNKAAEKE